MRKIILKLIILEVIIIILKFLRDVSYFGNFLVSIFSICIFALFLIIVFVLVMDFNILQAVGLMWRKIRTKNGTKLYSKMKYKNIEVSYLWRLNGGGLIIAYEFVHIISQNTGKVKHVFEYCSGPGFIGFSLLANDLCDKLTLADINPAAVEAVKETIRNNNLQDKVTVYQSDCLDSIPENEQWDLVVGNPPWDLVIGKIPWYQRFRNIKAIMVRDPEGRVHEKFYRDIRKFLKPNGSILFVEGGEYTNVNCFKQMIENNGLRIKKSFRAAPFLEIFKNFKEYRGFKSSLVIFLRFCLCIREAYFIWSTRKNLEDKVPQ